MTVDIRNLGFRYGNTPVLRAISFRLDPGRFHALLGPNGAGKSTLFGLLTRLLALQQGEIRIAGTSLARHPAAVMGQIGVVFQHSALDPDLTVRQNLAYHAALQGLSRREARRRGDRELARFGLLERANERVRQLNGGHRRRLEIARHCCTDRRCCCWTRPPSDSTRPAARPSTRTSVISAANGR